MRATLPRRLAGATGSLLLVGTLMLTAGPALGAPTSTSTRLVYIGSDPAFSANNGTITFTGVTAGQQAASNVYVKNIDNQTLNHVVVTFPISQPNGTTVSPTTYGANAGSCAASPSTGTPTSLVCDFGQLRAGATRSFTMVLTAGGGDAAVAGTIVYNESNNPNGGNAQIVSVSGNLTVGAATCNQLAAFLPPGQARSFLPSDGGSCATDGQRSGLKVPQSTGGSIVTIDDGSAAVAKDCGTYTCFGYVVSANVNNGALIKPYLTWTVFYSNATLGNINPKQVAFLHGTTIIPAGNKGLCKNATSTDCQEPYVVSAGGVTFFIRTPTNLVIKGMH
jgi:hypothetical protein